MQRRSFMQAAALAATGLATSGGTWAQNRSSPLTVVVPYPPGGAGDQISRLVMNAAASVLSRPVVIENKGGASGMIAAESVLRAAADGNTFFVGANAPMVINAAIYERMPYDPEKDFVPVSGMGKAPLLLVTRRGLGVSSLAELIELGKRTPGGFSMGSASAGNITHLVGEYAASKMGFEVTHVPFAGSAPSIANMLGEHVDIMFDALPSCMQHAKAGRLVPLAVFDDHRFPELPDVPTISELGYQGLNAAAWFGLMARAGTPESIIQPLNAAINEVLGRVELVKQLNGIGAQPMPGSADQFGQFIAQERAQWIPLAKSLGVKAG